MGKLQGVSPTSARIAFHDDGGRNIIYPIPVVIRGWAWRFFWRTIILRHGMSGRFPQPYATEESNRASSQLNFFIFLFFRVVISPGFGARRMDGATCSSAWGQVVAAKHGKKKFCIPRNWSERWKLLYPFPTTTPLASVEVPNLGGRFTC